MKALQRQAATPAFSPAQTHQVVAQRASLPAVHARLGLPDRTGLQAHHVIQPKQGKVRATTQMKRATDAYNDQRRAKVEGLLGQGPVQMKQSFNSGSGSPVSGGVIQLAKWKWSKAKKQWQLLSGSAAEGAPPYAGAYDGEIEEDEKEDRKDRTVKGSRLIGNSSALARNRYKLKPKKHDFKKWKRKREAQHIIPATLAKAYPILANMMDDAENGIMLPAKHKSTNTKVTHRKPNHYDHPTYNKNVRNLIKQVLKQTNLKNNKATMLRLMRALRPVNKLTAYQYIDDIPGAEFKQSWNAMNATYQLP